MDNTLHVSFSLFITPLFKDVEEVKVLNFSEDSTAFLSHLTNTIALFLDYVIFPLQNHLIIYQKGKNFNKNANNKTKKNRSKIPTLLNVRNCASSDI